MQNAVSIKILREIIRENIINEIYTQPDLRGLFGQLSVKSEQLNNVVTDYLTKTVELNTNNAGKLINAQVLATSVLKTINSIDELKKLIDSSF